MASRFALAVIFELGFPWPEQQVEFTCIGPDGARKVRRVDFSWYLPDGRIVVGELDGQQKYVDPSMTGGRSIAAIVEDERERSQMLYRCSVSAVVRFTLILFWRESRVIFSVADESPPPVAARLYNVRLRFRFFFPRFRNSIPQTIACDASPQ